MNVRASVRACMRVWVFAWTVAGFPFVVVGHAIFVPRKFMGVHLCACVRLQKLLVSVCWLSQHKSYETFGCYVITLTSYNVQYICFTMTLCVITNNNWAYVGLMSKNEHWVIRKVMGWRWRCRWQWWVGATSMPKWKKNAEIPRESTDLKTTDY